MDMSTSQAAMATVTAIRFELDRLETLLSPLAKAKLDPLDPRNKYGDKLTERGGEVCFRLFDDGVSIYGVHLAMKISYGGAKYRHQMWIKEGGADRKRKNLPEDDIH